MQTNANVTHVRAYFPGFRQIATNWDVRRAVILMGPRRVGKTVMLLQLVDHLISEGFPAKCIMLAPIDTPIYSGLPLDKLLAMFQAHTRHKPTDRRVVIFDEIQYLKEWEVHLKVLTDRHPNTGSSHRARLRRRSS